MTFQNSSWSLPQRSQCKLQEHKNLFEKPGTCFFNVFILAAKAKYSVPRFIVPRAKFTEHSHKIDRIIKVKKRQYELREKSSEIYTGREKSTLTLSAHTRLLRMKLLSNQGGIHKAASAKFKPGGASSSKQGYLIVSVLGSLDIVTRAYISK